MISAHFARPSARPNRRCAICGALDIQQRGDYVVFELAANAFLHHMVRNIVGSLVYVGKGNHDPAWIGDVLASRDRALAAPTLDAAGLYLAHVSYDAKWGLPPPARRAWFDEN